MYKITTEMCVDFLKGRYKSKMLAVSMLSLVALAVLWSLIRNIVIVAIVAAILMVLLSIYGLTIKHKIENIHLTEFYLAEDVVRDFKKRFRLRNRVGVGFRYIYTFKEYGRHVITGSSLPQINFPSRKERSISPGDVEELALQSCDEGDMFYLLICEEHRQKRIVQCFCKYHFDILKEDFEHIDGKYYCKQRHSDEVGV